MEHTIEPAASGRAKCRGCGEKIAKDELRFGARLPNPFVEGELVLWLHLPCGAYKLPAQFIEALTTTDETVENRAFLEAEAKRGVEHRRLPRLSAASRAPTGRATCRHCKEAIEKASWRIALVFFDDVEGRFNPGGYVHARCAVDYFETGELAERLRQFSPALTSEEVEEIRSQLAERADSAPS